MGDKTFSEKTKEFLWGLIFFDLYKEILHEKHRYEDAMNILFLGELLGIPLMTSIISLRIMPILFGDIYGWKLRNIKEKDFIDAAPDIH